MENLSKLREQIEDMNKQIEKAQQNYDLNKAAELQYGELPQTAEAAGRSRKKRLKMKISPWYMKASPRMRLPVSSPAGPAFRLPKLTEGERTKILHLDEELHKRVIGQDDGVQKVTDAIIRSKAGIKDPTKPIGSFLFLGPTGVGKTELAKALAAVSVRRREQHGAYRYE